MAGVLWGLWLCGPMRGGADGGLHGRRHWLVRCDGTIGVGKWRGVAIGKAWYVFAGGLLDKVFPANAYWCLCHEFYGERLPVAHELSFQKDRRDGGDGDGVPSAIIVPPQYGQGSCVIPALLPCCGRGVEVSTAGAIANSLRHSASFSSRWPLARKP